jgi:hypothetical protein
MSIGVRDLTLLNPAQVLVEANVTTPFFPLGLAANKSIAFFHTAHVPAVVTFLHVVLEFLLCK